MAECQMLQRSIKYLEYCTSSSTKTCTHSAKTLAKPKPAGFSLDGADTRPFWNSVIVLLVVPFWKNVILL